MYVTNSATVIINGGSFEENAAEDGAGMSLGNTAGGNALSGEIVDCYFRENRAEGVASNQGGAIELYFLEALDSSIDISIQGCTFIGLY